MKKEYDFSNSKANPYAKKLQAQSTQYTQITLNLNKKTIKYFKDLAKENGVSYEILIDSFLNDCANKRIKSMV